MTALLSAEGLSKHFGGVIAVDAMSFEMAAGEMFAIIGPNGAGKSTCFNMLGGQLKPDSGRVSLAGEDITGMASRALWGRGVGRAFQIAATFPSMTVCENLQVGLMRRYGRLWSILRSARKQYRAEAEHLLKLVGLGEAADKLCGYLSYGDLKRVELALSLVNEPRLLLMDEPTAGMAPDERRALMDLVVRLARERECGVLFTEHDMDVVFGYADRILVMQSGRRIAEGAPDAIRDNRQVQAVYLGQDFSLEPLPGSVRGAA